jgi:hypothetical protein
MDQANIETNSLFPVRCSCGRFIGYLDGKFRTKCSRCKSQININVSQIKGAVPLIAQDAEISTVNNDEPRASD